MKFWNLNHYNFRVAGCREPIWAEQLTPWGVVFITLFAIRELNQYWYVWKQYISISSSVQGQNWSINLPALSLCEAPAVVSPCVQPLVKYLEIFLIGKTQKKEQNILFAQPGKGWPRVSGSRSVKNPERVAAAANTAIGSHVTPVRRPKLWGKKQ